jgi:hypothetical protein
MFRQGLVADIEPLDATGSREPARPEPEISPMTTDMMNLRDLVAAEEDQELIQWINSPTMPRS